MPSRFGSRHGDGVVGEVDVQQLVVARGLAGVLRAADGHVHAQVVGSDEVGSHVDEQVAGGDGVE
jgi:hypothetical protein